MTSRGPIGGGGCAGQVCLRLRTPHLPRVYSLALHAARKQPQPGFASPVRPAKKVSATSAAASQADTSFIDDQGAERAPPP